MTCLELLTRDCCHHFHLLIFLIFMIVCEGTHTTKDLMSSAFEKFMSFLKNILMTTLSFLLSTLILETSAQLNALQSLRLRTVVQFHNRH